MNGIEHRISLRGEHHFGNRLPTHHLGYFFCELPLVIRQAVSMALRSRSTVRGKRPAWLKRASDVRFVDYTANGEVALRFEAPSLADAAPEVYQQQSLFPDLRPAPTDTGFDLLGDVLSDVQREEADSEHYDSPLLRRITKFQKFFHQGPFKEIDFTSTRYPSEHPARFTATTIESAKTLLGRTPTPQRVRLVGQLDGIEASTQRFSILLDSGDKVSGVFAAEQIDTMQSLWRQRVLVLGDILYRASGRVLRVEAEEVRPGNNEASVFSQLPTPPHARFDVSSLRVPQGARSGMAAIMGQWPGDETDEEVMAALEQLS